MTFPRGLVFTALWVLAGQAARTQEAPPTPGPPIRTLRVFSNLIQIPAVVLDFTGRPVQEKTNPKFTISLDGGKPFAASHSRLEGEDPISLAVLLDASGAQQELVEDMSWALPALANASAERKTRPTEAGLRERDHVSIYAVDCALVRSATDMPAERAALKLGVERVLRAEQLHGGRKHPACAARLPLRDVLIKAARELAQLPGRRVLLAVTSGNDSGSKADWEQVRNTMEHSGLPTLYASKLVMEMAQLCKAWKTMEPFPTLRTAAWKTLMKLASLTFPRPRRRDLIRRTSNCDCFTKASFCFRQLNAGRIASENATSRC